MSIVFYRLSVVIAVTLMAGSLGGCGTINGWLATGLEDVVPVWAGGLPNDAPPKPGTLKYDEWMKERERQRLQAAATQKDNNDKSAASLGPVY
jgi:hypothetical protein